MFLQSSLAVYLLAGLVILSRAEPPLAPEGAFGTYGRFRCSIRTEEPGVFVGRVTDASQCLDRNLVAVGLNTAGTGRQGDRPNPTNAQCGVIPGFRLFEITCGSPGATCSVDANCDGGYCSAGVCRGGYDEVCNGDDLRCSGFLYCRSPTNQLTSSNTCGGIGAFCKDYTRGGGTPDQDYEVFNQFCNSGYCNSRTAACDARGTTIGVSCASDPAYYCTQTSAGIALKCDSTSNTCQCVDPTRPGCAPVTVPSGRARARRNVELFRHQICPSSHTACPVPGSSARECIDTSTSLSDCGSCGHDCSALAGPGVDQLGCSNGRCETWSCLDGYRFDNDRQTCTPI